MDSMPARVWEKWKAYHRVRSWEIEEAQRKAKKGR